MKVQLKLSVVTKEDHAAEDEGDLIVAFRRVSSDGSNL